MVLNCILCGIKKVFKSLKFNLVNSAETLTHPVLCVMFKCYSTGWLHHTFVCTLQEILVWCLSFYAQNNPQHYYWFKSRYHIMWCIVVITVWFWAWIQLGLKQPYRFRLIPAPISLISPRLESVNSHVSFCLPCFFLPSLNQSMWNDAFSSNRCDSALMARYWQECNLSIMTFFTWCSCN